MALFAVKDILSNPFRHIERYPIKREKVEALRESLRTTGYWDNVVGRPKGEQVEIAYGHHRLAALKAEHEDHDDRVEVITRKLSDKQMLQIMARENMEVFGTSAAVEQETVRAVVTAAAEGTIQLEPPPKNMKKSDIRYAPSFMPGQPPAAGPAVPYTNRSVGRFLGWLRDNGEPQRKVSSSLWALQLIEEGLLKEKDFDGLSSTQAEAVVAQTRKVREREIKAARAEREEAEKRVREAERLRKKAEKEQKRLEKAAAEARDEKRRQQAQLEADRAARDRRLAEEVRKRADKELAKEKERERLRNREARRKAAKVGRKIGKDIKAGKLSTKRAGEAADEIAPKPEGPPPRITDYATRLAADVAGILTPERDRERVGKLNSLVKYRQKIPAAVRKQLTEELQALAGRAETYADALAK